jgi:hypothetical protein
MKDKGNMKDKEDMKDQGNIVADLEERLIDDDFALEHTCSSSTFCQNFHPNLVPALPNLQEKDLRQTAQVSIEFSMPGAIGSHTNYDRIRISESGGLKWLN